MLNVSEKYSDTSFWRKVRRASASAGWKVIKPAFILYNCMVDPGTPAPAKAAIAAALGYFILPVDILPDLTPVLGYTDDLSIILGAMGALGASIKSRHRKLADTQLEKLFG